MSSGDTSLFAFTVDFTNGVFKIDQPTNNAANGGTMFFIPLSQAVLKVHPTDPNFYYFGTNGNLNTLDYALCTNRTVASREAQLDAIIALAGGVPLGAVTISGQPISVTVSNTPSVIPSINLGEIYSTSNALSASGVALILRPNGTTVKLLFISSSTSTALSAGTSVSIQIGATITGGTWGAIAAIPGSLMEVNTGGSVGGTPSFQLSAGFSTSLTWDLSQYNIVYTTLQPIVVRLTQTGLGSTAVYLTWTETP